MEIIGPILFQAVILMLVFFVIYFTCHCNVLLIIKSLFGITLLFCKATIVHVTFNSCLSDPVYCVLESFISCPFRCNVIFICLIVHLKFHRSVLYLSSLYFRSAGQSGCMEGWAASNSGRSLEIVTELWRKTDFSLLKPLNTSGLS